MNAITSERGVNGKELQCSHPNCEAMIYKPARGQKFCSMFCKDQLHKLEREVGKRALTSKGMHCSSMEAPQVIKMLNYLNDRKRHSSIEIVMDTRIVGWHQIITSLRRHGYEIERSFRGVINDNNVFQYQLMGRA